MSKSAQAWFDSTPLPEFFAEIHRRQHWALFIRHFWAEITFVAELGMFVGYVQWTDRENRIGELGGMIIVEVLDE